MKTVGIVGGIGPESTIEYYRFIIEGYRQRQGDGSYPSIIVNSVDLDRLVKWINADEMGLFTDYLATAVDSLARAGADFAVLAANTAHVVFEELRERSPLPLISIAEATRDRAVSLRLQRPGLLGTRFTMQAHFYQKNFARAGITIVTPTESEQSLIHEKYFGELLRNIFLPETRELLLGIIMEMQKRDAIDGVILGGTELPLILRRDEHQGLPFLDTTQIHVDAIVSELLS